MPTESESPSTARSPKLPVFLRVFFALFFLCVAVSVLVSYAVPKTYASKAHIHVDSGLHFSGERDHFVMQTVLAFVASEDVMGSVVDQLQRQNGADSRSTRTEAIENLHRRIQAVPLRGTSLIAITAYGRRPSEASSLANAVAHAVVEAANESARRTNSNFQLLLTESAVAEPRPIRPNKPLNAAFGALVGIGIGLAGATGVLWLRRRIEQRQSH